MKNINKLLKHCTMGFGLYKYEYRPPYIQILSPNCFTPHYNFSLIKSSQQIPERTIHVTQNHKLSVYHIFDELDVETDYQLQKISHFGDTTRTAITMTKSKPSPLTMDEVHDLFYKKLNSQKLLEAYSQDDILLMHYSSRDIIKKSKYFYLKDREEYIGLKIYPHESVDTLIRVKLLTDYNFKTFNKNYYSFVVPITFLNDLVEMEQKFYDYQNQIKRSKNGYQANLTLILNNSSYVSYNTTIKMNMKDWLYQKLATYDEDYQFFSELLDTPYQDIDFEY